ncbi:LpqB family beta-propeller domain-containing protein [Microbacterium kribbense]|uniref:LpqB family beta-propeller domain-containing protein n=1 Tax=Microbacterium kribbense TaxID=433645 RepID=A0ABP7GJJ2_9MICO
MIGTGGHRPAAPRRARRGILAAVLAAAAVVLAGCTGLPTSGPVFAGIAPGEVAPPDFSFVPQKPQDGASPEQIVQGFVDAGIGPEGTWAVAQLYLAPSFKDQWKPNLNATIDDRAARAYVSDGDDKVSLTVTQRATVDATGAYKPSDGGQSTLPFTLAKVKGQWRITHAPNGIVLGADQFTGVFHPYALMYFDPGWHYLIPDVRWFPSSNAVTRIADKLIDGKPSPWLAGSVASAFPENIALARPSVPLSDGVAQVELSGPVLSLEGATLNRMQTQLLPSLSSVGGVTDVSMVYQGTALSAQPVATASTRIDVRPLARTDKGFGFLSATGQVEPIPGITEAMATVHPDAITLARDYTSAAVRTATGAVLRVPAKGQVRTLDARAGLIDPAVDALGYIWSVPARTPGALLAYGPDDKAVQISGGAWSNASQVSAISISRDGTRIAAILTVGGESTVAVFGIVRDADGVPQSLGDGLLLTKLPGLGIDLTWLDESTLGILAHAGDTTVEIQQIIGGPGTTTVAPDGVTTIAGTPAMVRLRGADGTLYSQRGSNWEQTGTGILTVGQAQGMPQ